jgi:hypothetical protein
MRSGTAKEEMEKFSGTPTPTISPVPTETPIDPGDIVQVDTTKEGGILTVNATKQEKALNCDKFNQVMVNSNNRVLAINGACRQIVVNGDGNQITADAAAEFVLNGTDNKLKYARFVNGKRPIVTQNQSGNEIEKIAFEPNKTSERKTGK